MFTLMYAYGYNDGNRNSMTKNCRTNVYRKSDWLWDETGRKQKFESAQKLSKERINGVGLNSMINLFLRKPLG